MSDSIQQRTRGKLFVIAAPSGAGKTTLVRALLEKLPTLEFSVSYTTRAKRASERHSYDYFFVDSGEFQQMIDMDQFLEHARVFDHCYGTSAARVAESLDAGRSVLLEIDWQGARQIKRKAPEAVSVFILPPSAEELERRLRGRGTDSEAVIARRLADAIGDMSHWDEFDHVVINDTFAVALADLAAIIETAGSNSTLSGALRERISAIAGEPEPK
jgi:guanylate kinase